MLHKVTFLFFIFVQQIIADAHIFTYHRFNDNKHSSTNTTLSQLKKDFDYLKSNNYEVIPFSTLVNALKNNLEINNRWIVFHIDDSYKSFYKYGYKIFRKYNYPFTLFVYTESANKNYGDYMRWEDIKEVSKFGEIALHSKNHPHLTKISNKEVIQDTQQAIKSFKKNMGYMPKYYVYPYGEYNDNVKNTIKSFGFESIGNQNLGAVSSQSDIFDLNRIAISGKSDLSLHLKLKFLPAIWRNIKIDNQILKSLKIDIDPLIKNIQLFVSGYGWQKLKVKNGTISVSINKPLKKGRTRIFIKTYDNAINGKIIIL